MSNQIKNTESKIISLSKDHYENFPVSSFIVPKEFRNDIAIIYWFARTADDIADEGKISDQKRLNSLDEFEKELCRSLKGKSQITEFNILAETIRLNSINPEYFISLLSAFKQDVVKNRYNDFNEVLDYCKRSANPVGRILLQLFKVNNQIAVDCSDKICTALQLTNFYQDTAIDFQKDRIYYPKEEMEMFSVTEKMFELNKNNPNIKALVKHNVERAQNLFNEGKEIISYLNGRFKLEIKWTIAGGEKILKKIRQNDYDVLSKRPKLSKIDFTTLLIKSLFNG